MMGKCEMDCRALVKTERNLRLQMILRTS